MHATEFEGATALQKRQMQPVPYRIGVPRPSIVEPASKIQKEICIKTNKMHKILVIRFYFTLDALHVSNHVSPSSGATL